MLRPTKLELSLQKASYLFNYSTDVGTGGDKQKFWQSVMGFKSAEEIQTAILAAVSVDDLQFQRQDRYGSRYQAVVVIKSRLIRTAWIVLLGETTARFVTAIPERSRRQS